MLIVGKSKHSLSTACARIHSSNSRVEIEISRDLQVSLKTPVILRRSVVDLLFHLPPKLAAFHCASVFPSQGREMTEMGGIEKCTETGCEGKHFCSFDIASRLTGEAKWRNHSLPRRRLIPGVVFMDIVNHMNRSYGLRETCW